jgi:hypothetical protein
MSDTIPTNQPSTNQPSTGRAAIGEARPGRRPTARRAIAVGVAVLAALLVWTVAAPVAGADLLVRSGGGTSQVNGVDVVLASLVAGLLAWGLRALLDKLTRRPGPAWTVGAAIALVLSVVGPLSATNGAAMAVLALLHLLVAGILIAGLSRPAGRP